MTLNPVMRRALRLIGERGAFNGTVRSHRLVVRTSPFHGEDVRAIRAESDLFNMLLSSSSEDASLSRR